MLEFIPAQTAEVEVRSVQPTYSHSISPELNANIILKKAEHPFGFTVQEFKQSLQSQISEAFDAYCNSIEQPTDEEIDALLKSIKDRSERVSNFSELVRETMADYYRLNGVKIEFEKEFTIRSDNASATFKLVKNQTLKNIENQINADFEKQKPFEQYKDVQWTYPYSVTIEKCYKMAGIDCFLSEQNKFENIYLYLIDFNDKSMVIEV